MSKTNIGLVEYCKTQLGKPYWYGTFGHKSTETLLKQKKMQYPNYYKSTDYYNQLGEKVHDCSGLIKGYFFCENENSYYSPRLYAKYQYLDSNIKYDYCNKKGHIKTIPDIPGVLVFMPRTCRSLYW